MMKYFFEHKSDFEECSLVQKGFSDDQDCTILIA